MKEFTLPTYAEATLDGLPLITYYYSCKIGRNVV